jgi:UDP:flavonoid glycosyltransferase YjiC (YdhE family)
MRVLFAATRGAGHFNPLVPFIEACLRGGHEVLVAGPPALAATVHAAGYPFWQGEAPPEEELGPVWARVPAASPDEAEAIVLGEIFAGLNVAAMLPRLREACRDWGPTVLLRDGAEFASAVAAELERVPHARVAVGLASSERRSLEVAGQVLDERHPGMAARIAASPYLSLFPQSLEDPDVTMPAVTHRFRDPVAGTSEKPLPDWWPSNEAPLVYATFGSVTGGLPVAESLFVTTAEALAQLPVRVLLTVGNEIDPVALGSTPPNVRIERWVPQADVLRHASVVVCHGGSGTTLGALAAGIPVVVVPLFADQPETGRRVAAVGAGVTVEAGREDRGKPIRTTVDPVALRDATQTVLADPRYGESAGAIAEEMRSLPPTDAALPTLKSAGFV